MEFRFVPELVLTDICAANQKEAIDAVASLLINNAFVNDEYPKLVLKRELQYPTGLVTKGAMIAMPHAVDHTIKGNHIAIGIFKKPIPFRNMEDIEQTIQVTMLFMLAISGAHEQLEMLQVLMQLFKEEKLLRAICVTKDGYRICNMLNAYIQTIHET